MVGHNLKRFPPCSKTIYSLLITEQKQVTHFYNFLTLFDQPSYSTLVYDNLIKRQSQLTYVQADAENLGPEMSSRTKTFSAPMVGSFQPEGIRAKGDIMNIEDPHFSLNKNIIESFNITNTEQEMKTVEWSFFIRLFRTIQIVGLRQS